MRDRGDRDASHGRVPPRRMVRLGGRPAVRRQRARPRRRLTSGIARPAGVSAARYEIRVLGRLSEPACSAFPAMDIRTAPAQTILLGEVAEQSGLRDLIALCSTMRLEIVSLQRLPG